MCGRDFLHSKSSYTLQYYATVDASHEFDDDSIPWLSTAHVEDRPDPEQSSLQEMAASGHSVGGIVDVTASQVRHYGQTCTKSRAH